ncbi:MAG: type IX secretion system membrane protein PorP/SprF [Comamonadaceae bacterium]|nr:type IX secretion system membrane protein PorP/SprF [Comamonadaceae bacterium]
MEEPLALDINGNFIIADIFWLGASYRTVEESVVGILELQLTQQLKLGYSYDYQMGEIGNFSSGSHEVLLRVEFGRKVSASSPKFFSMRIGNIHIGLMLLYFIIPAMVTGQSKPNYEVERVSVELRRLQRYCTGNCC